MIGGERRVALVTGASRGIGLEIARQLAAKGMTVLMGCRSEEKGRDAVRLLEREGLEPELKVIDVASEDGAARLMESVRAEYGRLDVLVNNAAVILDRGVSVLDVTEDAMRETFETNYFGALRLIQCGCSPDEGARIRADRQRVLGDRFVSSAPRAARAERLLVRVPSVQDDAKRFDLHGRRRDRGTGHQGERPGQVRTDIGGADAPLSVAEGADTAVWLAGLGEDGPNGGFFRNRAKAEW